MNEKPSLKSEILRQLKERKGEWVSGEMLRQEYGVSRTAISKNVRNLVRRGYHIGSSTRKGYCLQHEPDLLHPDVVKPLLSSTLFSADRYIFTEETNSTNDDAKQAALLGAPEGVVLVTEGQRMGRGRRGRLWFGDHGNSLLFSLVLRPPIAPILAPVLPLLSAVALHRTLVQLGLNAGIKWPNDVLIEGKKISGILCEISADMDNVQHAVVGIGLNVNTPGSSFPAEIADLACSMHSVTGKTFPRAEVLQRFLQNFEDLYLSGLLDQFAEVRRLWVENAVTLGQVVNLETPRGMITGTAKDITEIGALIVVDEAGQEHIVISGELPPEAHDDFR